MGDGIALEGMRLVKDWLPEAVANGANLEARSHMLIASSMGATAFQKGLGAMHSLSHPCSSVLQTHHGLTNAVVMPYVLVFNRAAIADKMAALARYLDLPKANFDGVMDWVMGLRATIGIPNTLHDIGVGEEHATRFARMAVEDPTAPTNPVPLTVENLEGLYRSAIAGTGL
jgi:alcohol dehydrogenase class IV